MSVTESQALRSRGAKKGIVVVRQNGFRRQPRLIENVRYWCGIHDIPVVVIDDKCFFAGDWGIAEGDIGAFYLPIADRYDPLEKIPKRCPAIVDFDANGSSNLPELRLGNIRYAVRNAFGIKVNASRPPEFQVPYVNRPMADCGMKERDVIIFDVKPFHNMSAQAAILALISEIAFEYERICAIAGRRLYLYFSSFMNPGIYMEAIDAFVRDPSVYNAQINYLRRISAAILPTAGDMGDYYQLMQRCRLFITEHGDIADIDLVQIGCLGVPILLYKRRPFYTTAGINLQTLAGAEAIEPRIRGVIEDAERHRIREEWGVEEIFGRDRVPPWNAEILESLFLKSWDLLWRWAQDGIIDARVNAAMNTDLPWKLGLEIHPGP